MTRYLIAIAMLGLTCLACTILSFGARFNGADELPSDAETQDAIREGIKRERAGHTHFGSASK